jgi:hypothetical protein
VAVCVRARDADGVLSTLAFDQDGVTAEHPEFFHLVRVQLHDGIGGIVEHVDDDQVNRIWSYNGSHGVEAEVSCH